MQPSKGLHNQVVKIDVPYCPPPPPAFVSTKNLICHCQMFYNNKNNARIKCVHIPYFGIFTTHVEQQKLNVHLLPL